MTTHDLKAWPEPFRAVVRGEKTHEVRVRDRPYAVGDLLILNEWKPCDAYSVEGWACVGGIVGMRRLCHACQGRKGDFTGDRTTVKVTHVTEPGTFGLPGPTMIGFAANGCDGGICVMSVRPLSTIERVERELSGEKLP